MRQRERGPGPRTALGDAFEDRRGLPVCGVRGDGGVVGSVHGDEVVVADELVELEVVDVASRTALGACRTTKTQSG